MTRTIARAIGFLLLVIGIVGVVVVALVFH